MVSLSGDYLANVTLKKKRRIDPSLVQPGDMILLSDFGRWTCKIRGDHGKRSRDYRLAGGWFLVISKERSDLRGRGDAGSIVELYNPEKQYWDNTVFWDDGEDEAEILDHVPAQT